MTVYTHAVYTVFMIRSFADRETENQEKLQICMIQPSAVDPSSADRRAFCVSLYSSVFCLVWNGWALPLGSEHGWFVAVSVVEGWICIVPENSSTATGSAATTMTPALTKTQATS